MHRRHGNSTDRERRKSLTENVKKRELGHLCYAGERGFDQTRKRTRTEYPRRGRDKAADIDKCKVDER